jgi:hypothetical protein
VLRALHWFNPLVWVACRHLRRESERACDDVVLRHGVEGSAYATQLIDIARSFGRHRIVWLPAPAMARATSLERRVAAMLNPAINRGPVTNRARIATIAAASILTASLAGFGASAQTFGSVSGSVVDATNRPIAGATLVLTGAPNQAKHELRSDAGDISSSSACPGATIDSKRSSRVSAVSDECPGRFASGAAHRGAAGRLPHGNGHRVGRGRWSTR